jgi:hypothetical protein
MLAGARWSLSNTRVPGPAELGLQHPRHPEHGSDGDDRDGDLDFGNTSSCTDWI